MKFLKYLFFVWVGFTSIVGSLYLVIEGTRIFGGEQSPEPYRGSFMATRMRDGMIASQRVVETPLPAVVKEEKPEKRVEKALQARDKITTVVIEEPKETPEQQVANAVGNNAQKKALEEFLNKAKTELEKEDLTFAKVKELYKEYEEKFKNVQLTSEQKQIEAQLNAYNNVVAVLTMKDGEKLKEKVKALAPGAKVFEQLNQKHCEWYLAIYWGDYRDPENIKKWGDKNLDRDGNEYVEGESTGPVRQSNQAGLNFFVKNQSKYKSFKDLYMFLKSRAIEK